MHTEQEMAGICKDLWKGGYYMGDPLDPMGESRYGNLSYISSLHAIYQVCIKPYITPTTHALEIGPGRGAWTKCMLSAKDIWCLDTLDPEHNGFWNYITEQEITNFPGRNTPNISYLKVSGFSCQELPDNYFDFFFSYGTFCHIPWEGQQLYYRNLFPKLRYGAMCFVMYAEANKYNKALLGYQKMVITLDHPKDGIKRLSMPASTQPIPKGDKDWAWRNKWFSIDPEELRQFLKDVGYQIINEDVGLNLRDPIIQFRKP